MQMKAKGKAYDIDHDAFEKTVLPDIQKGDLVIAIAIQTLGENTRRLLEAAAAKRATTALLLVSTEKPRPGSIPETVRHYCPIDVPYLGMVRGTTNEAELALKLCLNAITTGAHIMAGKVFTNVMIDLKISNSKLYDRAVGLVSQLSGADTLTSRRALHQAIFKEAPTSEESMDAVPMQTIISKAMAGRRVVALAILLASGKIPLDAALKRLDEEPRVRRLIESVVRGEA
jgi:N-acetylmuramic acid 6-phosphate (MurNAc-6-P) etherase